MNSRLHLGGVAVLTVVCGVATPPVPRTSAAHARAPASAPEPSSAPTARAVPHSATARPRLAVAGFTPAADGDERDAWIAVALEELTAARLRRAPGLVVLPPIRLVQARAELTPTGGAPPAWLEVARALGATHLLTGTTRGPSSACAARLELVGLRDGGRTSTHEVPVGRFFALLDDTTRVVLDALCAGGAQAVPAALFTPPSRSVDAIESFAKAVAAARVDDVPGAARHAADAVDADGRFRAAAALLAQLELRGGATRQAAARLRALAVQARMDDDRIDRAAAELGQAVLLQRDGAFDAAMTRAETALSLADACDDPYARVAALSTIGDLYLARTPPPGAVLTPERLRRVERDDVARAAEWQELLVAELDALGDRVGNLPATNKLALLYERLGRVEDALRMHERTLALATELNSRRHQATAWMYLGNIHRAQQRWRAALDALDHCLTLADAAARPAVQVVIGGVYLDMGQPQEACAQFESARAALRTGDDLPMQLACLTQLARTYRQLGRSAEALKTLQEAIDLAHALESPEERALRAELDKWRQNGKSP